MNPYLQEYITRTREYHAKDGKPSSVAALYDLADELAKFEDLEAKTVLVDLYEQLGLYTSAYNLFTEILDKPDRKQLKKLSRLQEMSQSHGDRFALPRPLNKKEKRQRQELLHILSIIQIRWLQVHLLKEKPSFVHLVGKKVMFIMLLDPIVLKR